MENGVKVDRVIDITELENENPICFVNFCNLNGDCQVVDQTLTCFCYKGYYGFYCQHNEKDHKLLTEKTNMMWKMVSEKDTFDHIAVLNKDRLDIIENLIEAQAQLMTNNEFFLKAFNALRKVKVY